MGIKPDSNIQRVLAVIRSDPGVNATHIAEQLGDVTTEQVSFSLAHLRRTNQIENRGKAARGAAWYEIEELSFDMLRTRKPKRGICPRCWTNPTWGLLRINVLSTKSSSQTPLVSLTTSLCHDCLEHTFMALAEPLTQTPMFGNKACPKCKRDRPVIGRIALAALEYTTRNKGERNPTFKTVSHLSAKYCEHCAVETYREVTDLRDNIIEDNPAHNVRPITG